MFELPIELKVGYILVYVGCLEPSMALWLEYVLICKLILVQSSRGDRTFYTGIQPFDRSTQDFGSKLWISILYFILVHIWGLLFCQRFPHELSLRWALVQRLPRSQRWYRQLVLQWYLSPGRAPDHIVVHYDLFVVVVWSVAILWALKSDRWRVKVIPNLNARRLQAWRQEISGLMIDRSL